MGSTNEAIARDIVKSVICAMFLLLARRHSDSTDANAKINRYT